MFCWQSHDILKMFNFYNMVKDVSKSSVMGERSQYVERRSLHKCSFDLLHFDNKYSAKVLSNQITQLDTSCQRFFREFVVLEERVGKVEEELIEMRKDLQKVEKELMKMRKDLQMNFWMISILLLVTLIKLVI